MVILKRSFLLSTLLSFGCEVSLVPSDYRGEVLFSVEGLVTDFTLDDSDNADLSAGLFWSTTDDTTTDPSFLIQHERVAVGAEFPARFKFNVFSPPERSPAASAYQIGQLLIFDDRNRNQTMDAGELRGGAPFHAIIYANAALPREQSPTGRPLPAGFSLVTLPLPCEVGGLVRGLDEDDCGVRLGATCEFDGMCGGPGTCVTSPYYFDFRDGYCAISETSTSCTPANGTLIGFFLDGDDTTVTYLWLKACQSNADCRADHECQFAIESCVRRSPVSLDVDDDFAMASLCVE